MSFIVIQSHISQTNMTQCNCVKTSHHETIQKVKVISLQVLTILTHYPLVWEPHKSQVVETFREAV